MRLTDRVGGIAESATVGISGRAKALRAQGVDVIDLSAGEPDFASPPVAVDAAVEALRGGMTKYTENAGTPPLREALAASYQERYGAPWGASQVLVTIGAKMALFQLSQALFQPGDEVLLPSPYWVSFPEQIRFAGAEPVFVPTSHQDGFRIHAEPLIEAITPRTRGILINAPCNPTGGIIDAAALRRLVEACAERGIVLISDETYERFLYDGAAPVSAASLATEFPDTVIVVGSFSKTYAMTGWRVGYVFGSATLIKALGRIQSHATSNVTSFTMPGAVAALHGAEADVQRSLAEYAVRRDLLMPLLNAIPGFHCPPPAGAFYAFPHVADCYRPGRAGSLELAAYLLDAARVAVVPGIAFGDDAHIRLSFACSQEQLREGIARIQAALE